MGKRIERLRDSIGARIGKGEEKETAKDWIDLVRLLVLRIALLYFTLIRWIPSRTARTSERDQRYSIESPSQRRFSRSTRIQSFFIRAISLS